jgi:UDP:flavonoid glycosyltransferase YjiC (YdhE family)
MADGKKIVIFTSGSRGDVQPYCALGLELASRGCEVTLCTEERVRPLVESFGLR